MSPKALVRRLHVPQFDRNVVRRAILPWLLTISLALTLFSNLEAVLRLAGWAHFLALLWLDLLHRFWSASLGAIGVDIHASFLAPVSFVVFLLLLATASRGPPGEPPGLEAVRPSKVAFVYIAVIYFLGFIFLLWKGFSQNLWYSHGHAWTAYIGSLSGRAFATSIFVALSWRATMREILLALPFFAIGCVFVLPGVIHMLLDMPFQQARFNTLFLYNFLAVGVPIAGYCALKISNHAIFLPRVWGSLVGVALLGGLALISYLGLTLRAPV